MGNWRRKTVQDAPKKESTSSVVPAPTLNALPPHENQNHRKLLQSGEHSKVYFTAAGYVCDSLSGFTECRLVVFVKERPRWSYTVVKLISLVVVASQYYLYRSTVINDTCTSQKHHDDVTKLCIKLLWIWLLIDFRTHLLLLPAQRVHLHKLWRVWKCECSMWRHTTCPCACVCLVWLVASWPHKLQWQQTVDVSFRYFHEFQENTYRCFVETPSLPDQSGLMLWTQQFVRNKKCQIRLK